jgi:exodeoxyribonuclease VII large subunit
MMTDTASQKIYTVSQLTADIKEMLENRFPFIWVCGEISNFRIPASGHFYFTLRDELSQISAMMFRGQNRSLKFIPEDGMTVTGLGRLSLYEPRGTYQIIFEYLEPKGLGALQASFEQLKARLSAEGLFDEEHKKPIPFLPKKIAVITSPTGAVIHDIITIVSRRFANVHIEIFPVRVQGEGAAQDIVSAIQLMNLRADADVAILARGGGSLEDLSAFNTEIVSRAIFASKIPMISAVGHETDFTIADFVADMRAPTPSAAAELVVPLKDELKRRILELESALKHRIYTQIERYRNILNDMSKRLIHPQKNIQMLRLKLDEITERLIFQMNKNIQQQRERLSWKTDRLNNLSVFTVLSRGYGIVRTVPKAVIIKDSDAVTIGEEIEILLEKGALRCRVEGKSSWQNKLMKKP